MFQIREPGLCGLWSSPALLLEFWQDHADHPPLPRDESGATAIEYGLIAAGIALAIIAVVNNLAATLNKKFTSISSSLKQRGHAR